MIMEMYSRVESEDTYFCVTSRKVKMALLVDENLGYKSTYTGV